MRFFLTCLIGTLFASLSLFQARAKTSASDFPVDTIAQYVADHFDLSTIRSSLGPRRTVTMHTFRDLKEIPTLVEPNRIVFDSDNWHYEIVILGVKDYRKSGAKDIAICFTDEAKHGSYYTQTPYLLAPDNKGYLLALAFPFHDETCKALRH